MNVKKIYMEFINKYPSYANDIVTYKLIDNDKGLELKLANGKTAWYYPAKEFTEDNGTNYK